MLCPSGFRTMCAALAIAAALLTAACAGSQASADAGRDAFLEWAGRQAAPVSAGAVARVAGDARVVALGEAAHGVEETLAARNALLAHLVGDRGFTGIALETGYAESLRLADFIAGGPGDADEVARTAFTSGFGNFKGNAELIAWLRKQNAGRPAGRRLRLIGIDLSLGGPLGSWATPAPVDCALAALAGTGGERAAASLRATFDREIRPALLRQTPLSAAEQDRYAAFARTLARAAGGSGDRVAKRCATVAEQAGEVSRVTPPPASGGIPPGAWRALEARDLAMADNALAALDELGPGGKLLVFAHNAHVMNEPQRAAHLRALAEPPRSMGQRLREQLGADLVIVAEAAPGPAMRGAEELGDLLRSVTAKGTLLDLRLAPPPARGFLLQPQRLRANIDGHAIVTPATAFDALLIR